MHLPPQSLNRLFLSLSLLAAVPAATATMANVPGRSSIAEVIDQVQPKMVKIYGTGGFRGMENFQSGILISPEGHILTMMSYVLDTDYITAILNDGRRFEAKLLGADPRLEVAVLKIDADRLPYFGLGQAAEVEAGTRVLAFSNLFGVATGDEPASVQHGIVSVKTTLAGRRGVFETPYRGSVYVLDAITNNPGAAGGALVTRRGRLVAMLGKELRNALNNTWLNYAVPIKQLRESVDAIRAGKFVPGGEGRFFEKQGSGAAPDQALELEMLGIVLVPDVLERTPPYVEHLRGDSPAEQAGIQPDDLILLLDDRLIQSCKALRDELEQIDFQDQVTLTVLRSQELLEFVLQVSIEDERNLP